MTPRPGDNGEQERKRRQLVGRVFWTRSRKETFAAWLFIFPDCIGLLVFVAIPMALALSLGFFSVDGFGGYKFVGLANYNRMHRDPLFIKSLCVTIVYVLCLVPGLYAVATDEFLRPPGLHGVRGFGFCGIRSHLCHDKWG